MADTKITDLTAITSGVASTDVTVLVDVSDTTMAASGTDKKITVGDLATAVTSVGSLATDAEVSSAVSTHAALTSSVHGITAFGASLVDDVDASAARTTLGLGTIATQAASSVSISGGTVTGITDLAVADGGTGASTAADARTNLGLVIGTNVQAYDGELAAIAGLTSAADTVPYFTGSGTASLATFTAAGRALVDDADASAQRTTLGLAAIASSGSATDLSAGTVPTARLGSGTANSSTFLRGDNTWAAATGGGADPIDIPRTFDPALSTTGMTNESSGNWATYLRALGPAASISKFGMVIVTSAGNISIAHYSNTGTGRSAQPGTRNATSGSVACPALGYAEVSLGSTVSHQAGDWFGLSSNWDSIKFAYVGVSALSTTNLTAAAQGTLANGRAWAQTSAHPLPATPTPTAGYKPVILLGVP